MYIYCNGDNKPEEGGDESVQRGRWVTTGASSSLSIVHLKLLFLQIQGDFLNWASPENVSRLAPTNLLGLPPPPAPKFSGMVGIISTSPDT